MPVGRSLSTRGALSSMIPEEGSESFDSFIKQAVSREQFIPFSRTADSQAQLLQLLHGLEQPDIPGWPFLTGRIEMQKCGKCPQQFCSPINYKRHIRVHRRNLNANAENRLSRDILAAFWDKLSWEESDELLSFNGVMLKDVPGPKIIDALDSSLRTSAVWAFPEAYAKAGSTLLDIIKKGHSGLPNSYELFRILDAAAEGTFLCAGTAESVGKHVLEGESVDSLDLKILIASIGFLFELQLVKAWFAEKDAEALRLQKLLVEEEEAEQKKQTDILEKKRQKKLRRKEHRVKEIDGNYEASIVVDSLEAPVSARTSDPSPDFTSSSASIPSTVDSVLESLQFESDTDIEAQLQHINHDDSETIESQNTTGPRHVAANRWQVPKSQRVGRGGSHLGQNHYPLKRELAHSHGSSKNWVHKNGIRVWTKKCKAENEVNSLKPPVVEEETTSQSEVTGLKPPALEVEATPQIKETGLKPPALEEEARTQFEEIELNPPAMEEEITPQIRETELEPLTLQEETTKQVEETEGEQLMIGTIPIVLKSSASSKQEKNVVEKPTRADSQLPATKRVTLKQWRPVSRGENNSPMPVNKDEAHDQSLSAGNCMLSEPSKNGFDNVDVHLELSDGNVQEGSLPFCSKTAQEFLARRWKEAISADHVKLELSSPPKPGGSVEHDQSADSQAPNTQILNVVGNAENKVGSKGKGKYRKKKQQKVKYIPKQKS